MARAAEKGVVADGTGVKGEKRGEKGRERERKREKDKRKEREEKKGTYDCVQSYATYRYVAGYTGY